MNGYKMKIVAILVACIVVAAAVGVPVAFGEDAPSEADVEGVPPVVETITITPDDEGGTPGVQINTNTVDTGDRTVTITALVYCENGVDEVDTVKVTTIAPAITGAAVPITMTMLAGNPGLHKKNYAGSFDLTPCQTGDVVHTVTVTATHKKDGVADGTNTADFTVTQLMAMSTSGVIFDVGEETAPGDVATGTATVKCQGNVAIEFADVGKITWTGLTSVENPEHVIPLTSIALKTSTYTWGTAIACGLTDDIGFDLTIPMGTAAETYTGTITFTPSAVPS